MPRRSAKETTVRLGPADWMNAALDTIAEKGLRGVAVESLAERLGVTKGSFYWHFKNRNDLLVSTLEYWETRWTDEGHVRLREIEDPRERLRELFRVVFRRFDRAAVNISLHDSATDERVREVVERVTEKRMNLLKESYFEMGYSKEETAFWALKAYSTYVGMHEILRIYREPLGDDFDRFVDHVLDSLVPDAVD